MITSPWPFDFIISSAIKTGRKKRKKWAVTCGALHFILLATLKILDPLLSSGSRGVGVGGWGGWSGGGGPRPP